MDKSTTPQSEPTSQNQSLEEPLQLDFLSSEKAQSIKDLPKQGKFNDLKDKRFQQELTLRHWVTLVLIAFLCICALALVGTYVANLVLPAGCRWLSPGDMSAIKDIVVSIVAGLVMSLAIKYVTR
ncbi:hypothetical protein [uncultured Sutterella sp.]|uniref:hypothetical protein n=1 Tax=uncultured Sutterella sp. TaxID=286133 RepID=UPI0020608012|nr:hypothetical protein [uncultured Sutterella sp.]DAO35529.1 MAG TPA: hypothetical protein [Caudoviricetes sp.]